MLSSTWLHIGWAEVHYEGGQLHTPFDQKEFFFYANLWSLQVDLYEMI